MIAESAADGLKWADMLMEATFFIMQIYLTDVWKLSFTSAATLLNIWGGVSKILPIFFLFLADTLLGNILTLALSGLLSTTGLVLITVTTMPGYRCLDDDEDSGTSCVGHKEKVLFITGMGLVALGRAARSASSEPFLEDQSDSDTNNTSPVCAVILFITPAVGFFVFPYIKRWYLLFGVSAICTALATLFFLACLPTYKYNWGPREDGSPLTDSARVFVAAAFNLSRSLPEDNDSYHSVPNEEFQELSSTRIFGFLHKAAILPAAGGGPKKKRSWRLCSVSEVESTKILIRTVTVSSSFLLCGVVSSTADTYFIEQATNLSTRIGPWKAPLQLFLVILMFYKFVMTAGLKAAFEDDDVPEGASFFGTVFAVVYCAVAAAVERRRLHVVRRRGLIRRENVRTPMSVAWLIFQAFFLWMADVFGTTGLAHFHRVEGPASMGRYAECMSEAVSGMGFMCGALLVYVVGKISETGGGKGWFQQTLNRSRLDRYYWVLAALGSVYFVVSLVGFAFYTPKDDLKRLQVKEKELTPLGAEENVRDT